jgi:hypothetical protein
MKTEVLIRSAEPDVRSTLFEGPDRREFYIDGDRELPVSLTSHRKFRSGEFAEIIGMAIQWGGSVGMGIVSNWLYERLKNRRVSLSVNGRPVEINKDAITKAVASENVDDQPGS